MATGVATDPQWAPCATCDCVEGVASRPRWELVGIVDATSVCPRRATTEDSRGWIALYAHYKDGHLLRSGGLFSQPAIYLEAMRIVQFAVGAFDA
jgi:hypothetical protein